jgi:HSP20 family protein
MIRYPDQFVRIMPLRRLLDRMLEDMWQGNSYEAQGGAPQVQSVPVNIFQTPEQLIIVAPMPGVAPGDIDATVTAETVHLKAEYRGPHQEEQDYVVREWSYGPYERTIQLPFGVDAERANASFNNGVLVLTLPRRNVTRSHRISLNADQPGASSGHAIGSEGGARRQDGGSSGGSSTNGREQQGDQNQRASADQSPVGAGQTTSQSG